MSFSSLGNLVQQGLDVARSINPADVLMKLPSSDQVTGQALLVTDWIKHPGDLLMKLPSSDQATGQALLVAEWIKHPGENQKLYRLK